MDGKCGLDETLLEKYNKLLTGKKIMNSNKQIKFFPIPDCDGYAEKSKNIYAT